MFHRGLGKSAYAGVGQSGDIQVGIAEPINKYDAWTATILQPGFQLCFSLTTRESVCNTLILLRKKLDAFFQGQRFYQCELGKVENCGVSLEDDGIELWLHVASESHGVDGVDLKLGREQVSCYIDALDQLIDDFEKRYAKRAP